MSTLVLFFFHVGFIMGAFLLSLVVGTLVFYFRKAEASYVGCGARFIERTSDDSYPISHVNSAKAAFEADRGAQVGGSSSKDFDDAKIVFPLRQTDWASRHVLSSSPSSYSPSS